MAKFFIILRAYLVLFEAKDRLCFAFPDLKLGKLLPLLPVTLAKLIIIDFTILVTHLNNNYTGGELQSNLPTFQHFNY